MLSLLLEQAATPATTSAIAANDQPRVDMSTPDEDGLLLCTIRTQWTIC
jgi:hypothetical protein